MKITIKDIAKQVGTVPSTVSRALNNKEGVSQKMRIQILEAAKQMGYFPNATARSLVLNCTETLGFVVHRRQSLNPGDFYGEIMEGVESVTRERGYHLVFSTHDAKTLPSMIQAKRVDGLILAGCDFDERFILSLKRKGIPLVLVDNHLPLDEVDSVITDNAGGAYQAVKHLVELGHAKIAFIAEHLDDLSFRERFKGYKRALEACGLDYDEALVAEGRQRSHEPCVDSTMYGRVAMGQILKHKAATAVLAANDATAAGALRALKEVGLCVPKEMAVVGFDDGPLAQHTLPPLSTMRIFRGQMGIMAAKRLFELVENPKQTAVQSKLATRLIVRASCGEAP